MEGPHVSTDDAVYWDPYDPVLAQNPHPVFARLREEAPLYYNEKYDFHLISRFDDCDRALHDWRTFRSGRGNILELIKSGIELPPGTLIMEDPPSHDIHRKLLARMFTPRRIAALEPQVRQYCSAALDPLVGADRFDLMAAVGTNLPMRVIGMLVGIPEADQVAFREATDSALRTEPGEKADFRGGATLSNEAFNDYLDWRTRHPSDDIMTELLHAEFDDEHGVRRTLTRDEVVTYLTVVAGAGNETTGRLIGWIGSILAAHPEQRRELAADPLLIPNAVEEILRMEPAGPAIGRYVAEDVEFHGGTVPAGSAMLILIAAANRDPRRVPDGDRFDIHRDIRHQLAFGYGLHFCLGASLARLEGRIAMEELLKRFPSWDVDWDNAKLASTSTVRGWESLPLIVGSSVAVA
jgi:cytochrome P450